MYKVKWKVFGCRLIKWKVNNEILLSSKEKYNNVLQIIMNKYIILKNYTLALKTVLYTKRYLLLIFAFLQR